MDRSLGKDGSVTTGGRNPQPGMRMSAGQPRDVVSRTTADGLSRNIQHRDDTQQADRAGHNGKKQQRDVHTKDSHLAPDTVPRVNAEQHAGHEIQLRDGNPKDDQPGDIIPRVGSSKDDQPGDSIAHAGSSKDDQPGDTIPRVGSSKDDQPGDAIPHDGSSKDDQSGDTIPHDDNPKDDQPGDTIPRVGNSKDDQPGDTIPHDGSSKDNQPGDTIPHDDRSKDDQPANVPQEEEKEGREPAWLTLSQSLAALLPPVVFWGVSVLWELFLSVFIPQSKGFKGRKRGEERETGQRDPQNRDGKPKRGDSKVQETMRDGPAQRPVHDAPQRRGRE